MKPADVYLKWVEWSEEDGVYIGRCPDLFYGGCHGCDPVAVYAERCETVDEMVALLENAGQPFRKCNAPSGSRLIRIHAATRLTAPDQALPQPAKRAHPCAGTQVV